MPLDEGVRLPENGHRDETLEHELDSTVGRQARTSTGTETRQTVIAPFKRDLVSQEMYSTLNGHSSHSREKEKQLPNPHSSFLSIARLNNDGPRNNPVAATEIHHGSRLRAAGSRGNTNRSPLACFHLLAKAWPIASLPFPWRRLAGR